MISDDFPSLLLSSIMKPSISYLENSNVSIVLLLPKLNISLQLGKEVINKLIIRVFLPRSFIMNVHSYFKFCIRGPIYLC